MESFNDAPKHASFERPTPPEYIRLNNDLKRSGHAIHLPRQIYILGMVVIYSSMFLVAWSILCLTSMRPIGRASYYCYDSSSGGQCTISERARNQQNERTLRYVADAQTILSAVSLLTIPLTSAVCAAASVPWLQSSGKGMSLRQLMTLADKGWTSPYIYTRLLRPSGWKRYGSSFLALSLLMNALGAALSPAISRLSAPRSIKVPTNTSTISSIFGMDDLMTYSHAGRDPVLQLRDALRSGSPIEFEPRLWRHEALNCSDEVTHDLNKLQESYVTPSECKFGGLTYQSLASVGDAWVSQLPNGFNTGVIPGQFLPRVNSSVSAERVESMPAICEDGNAALVINHEGKAPEDDGEGGSILTHHWYIKACIPEYWSTSPFEWTGNRQTISETLYLDMYSLNLVTTKQQSIFRITVNTTLGYFRLPSYASDDKPGPLLANYSIQPPESVIRRDVLEYTSEMNSTHEFDAIEGIRNKGPLLNTVYALFGNGSMPAIYANENETFNPGYQGNFDTGYDTPCVDTVPLTRLFKVIAPASPDGNLLVWPSACLSARDVAMGIQMHRFIENFFLPDVDMVARVFRVAAYMSHSMWLQGVGGRLQVQQDKGIDLQKPGLVVGSIVGLSLAISVFLIALMTLAFYASLKRSWTWSLDSYALLRIGADLGKESLPFLAVKDVDQIAELDDLPGWVGDTDIEVQGIGEFSMGHLTEVRRINPQKKYKAYEHVRRGWWWIDFKIDRVFSLGGLRRTRASEKARWTRAKANWLGSKFQDFPDYGNDVN